MNRIMNMKQCSNCRRDLSLECFSTDNSRKDGKCYRCKDCVKAAAQANVVQLRKLHQRYRRNNTKKITAKRRQYNKRNATQQKIRRKVYDAQNTETRKQRQREYYLNHREERKYKQREYRRNNLQKVRQQDKRYRQITRNAHRKYRRIAISQRTPSWLIPEQRQQIIEIYKNCPEGMIVDHIYPLQGKYVNGLHHPDNLQYLTPEENLAKGNSSPTDQYWEESELYG